MIPGCLPYWIEFPQTSISGFFFSNTITQHRTLVSTWLLWSQFSPDISCFLFFPSTQFFVLLRHTLPHPFLLQTTSYLAQLQYQNLNLLCLPRTISGVIIAQTEKGIALVKAMGFYQFSGWGPESENVHPHASFLETDWFILVLFHLCLSSHICISEILDLELKSV